MTSYPPPFDPTSQPQQPPQPPPPPVFPPGVYPQGIYPPPLCPQPTRPTWATAIGVISTVLGGLALICTPIGLLINLVNPSSREMMHKMYQDWYASYALISSAFSVVIAVLLLTAGIMLLKKRPSTRPLHLAYAITSIVLTILNYFVALMATTNMASMESEAARVGMKISMAVALPVGLAYPVFILAWFLRPKITATIREWAQKQ